MNEVELVRESLRAGLLVGILIGGPIWIVLRECMREFDEWLKSLEHHRVMRCRKDWK